MSRRKAKEGEKEWTRDYGVAPEQRDVEQLLEALNVEDPETPAGSVRNAFRAASPLSSPTSSVSRRPPSLGGGSGRGNGQFQSEARIFIARLARLPNTIYISRCLFV